MDTFKLYFINKFSKRKWHKKWRDAKAKKDNFLAYGEWKSTVIDSSKSVLTLEVLEEIAEEERKNFGRP